MRENMDQKSSGYGYFLRSGCSIVGDLLCYHASHLDMIPSGGHAFRTPNLLKLILDPSEVGKSVPGNTMANELGH